jgi:Xaa-Pro dipeptidase
MKDRILKILSLCRDMDCAVFLNGVEPHLDMAFFYATGLTSGLFEGGCAVVHPGGRLDLVSSRLEEQSAKRCNAQLHLYRNQTESEELIASILAKKKTIGINSEELTYTGLMKLKRCAPRATFIDISAQIKQARAVKDSEELELMRCSCNIASQVAQELPGRIREGMREYELAAEIAYMLQRKGADKPNFTLVQFGPNSAEPHYMGGDSVLKRGKFILLDFGCVYKRYNSDITRTFVLGRASPRQKKIHDAVAQAQQVAFDLIVAGSDAKDIHSAVDASISKAGHNGLFTHATGHSLGLATHDGLRLFDYSLKLEENMVFTVEPGIYVPGYGGVRIEDDVVVTAGKPDILTAAPRELIEI